MNFFLFWWYQPISISEAYKLGTSSSWWYINLMCIYIRTCMWKCVYKYWKRPTERVRKLNLRGNNSAVGSLCWRRSWRTWWAATPRGWWSIVGGARLPSLSRSLYPNTDSLYEVDLKSNPGRYGPMLKLIVVIKSRSIFGSQ